MSRNVGDGIAFLLYALFAVLPFGLWKLCEIVVWIWRHVHFGSI